MSMNDFNAVWELATKKLEEEMNAMSFNVWIKKLRPVCASGGEFVLLAENDIVRTQITEKYAMTVTDVINAVSGKDYNVVCITSSELKEYEARNCSAESSVAPMLNSNYTFETFVVGESNRFAHAAALAVAERPAAAYNPLFLYGGVGLGKTHLMHAIGHVIYSNNKNARILYVTSEAFANELIAALQEGRNVEFRNKYRDIDVLMIDDVQFFAGKPATENEFFHTFNQLKIANKQIILTSDRPVRELATLEPRLLSRFESGVVADIQVPDFETRAAILRKRAEAKSIAIGNDVLYYIAKKVDSNIRELEGAFIRVVAHAQLTDSVINIALVDKVLADMFERSNSRRLTIEIIVRAVSEYFGVPVDDIMGKRRDKSIVKPRQIAMFLARKLISAPYEDIGEQMGGKHYSTVMHSCTQIEDQQKTDRELRAHVEDIENRLRV